MTQAVDSPPAEAAFASLLNWMRSFSRVIVAYSGGVDSALVLAAARRALGEGALACIGVSPSYPQRELDAAVDLAKKLAARIRLVRTAEHLDPRYAANPARRCYFCKSELYAQLGAVRVEENADAILDGTQASDLLEIRHGYIAATEAGVRSPLAELKFDKAAVRDMARLLGLSVWDKPAAPCLASRVPTGVAIDAALLARIEQAENALARLGFTDFRVRHHGEVARIELPPDRLAEAIERRQAIIDGVRAAGYRHVSLDLAGLRGRSLPLLPPGA